MDLEKQEGLLRESQKDTRKESCGSGVFGGKILVAKRKDKNEEIRCYQGRWFNGLPRC
jgi:hypothetical protein